MNQEFKKFAWASGTVQDALNAINNTIEEKRLIKIANEDNAPYRDRAEVFAISPSGKIYGGQWDGDKSFAVPGGGVDSGEEIAEAGAREFMEEAGLKVSNPRIIYFVPPIVDKWSDKYRSTLPADRQKYIGSRTHYVLADIDEGQKKLKKKLDKWDAENKKFYSPEEALRLQRKVTGSKNSKGAPWEARKQVIEYIAKKLKDRQRLQKKAEGPIDKFINQPIDRATTNISGDILNSSIGKGLGWGLGGAAIGGAVGGISSMFAPKKKRKTRSNILTGALMGGLGGAGLGVLSANMPSRDPDTGLSPAEREGKLTAGERNLDDLMKKHHFKNPSFWGSRVEDYKNSFGNAWDHAKRWELGSAAKELDIAGLRHIAGDMALPMGAVAATDALLTLKNRKTWNAKAILEGLKAEGGTIPGVSPETVKILEKSLLEDNDSTFNRIKGLDDTGKVIMRDGKPVKTFTISHTLSQDDLNELARRNISPDTIDKNAPVNAGTFKKTLNTVKQNIYNTIGKQAPNLIKPTGASGAPTLAGYQDFLNKVSAAPGAVPDALEVKKALTSYVDEVMKVPEIKEKYGSVMDNWDSLDNSQRRGVASRLQRALGRVTDPRTGLSLQGVGALQGIDVNDPASLRNVSLDGIDSYDETITRNGKSVKSRLFPEVKPATIDVNTIKNLARSISDPAVQLKLGALEFANEGTSPRHLAAKAIADMPEPEIRKLLSGGKGYTFLGESVPASELRRLQLMGIDTVDNLNKGYKPGETPGRLKRFGRWLMTPVGGTGPSNTRMDKHPKGLTGNRTRDFFGRAPIVGAVGSGIGSVGRGISNLATGRYKGEGWVKGTRAAGRDAYKSLRSGARRIGKGISKTPRIAAYGLPLALNELLNYRGVDKSIDPTPQTPFSQGDAEQVAAGYDFNLQDEIAQRGRLLEDLLRPEDQIVRESDDMTRSELRAVRDILYNDNFAPSAKRSLLLKVLGMKSRPFKDNTYGSQYAGGS